MEEAADRIEQLSAEVERLELRWFSLKKSAEARNAKLAEAVKCCVDAHKGQSDKGGQPYILHPLRLMIAAQTDDERIVSLLHDTVEDSELTVEQIRHKFGHDVAEAVDAMTRRTAETYEAFIDRCATVPLARSVKLLDLADNMDLTRLGRTPTVEDQKRYKKYAAARAALEEAKQ